MNNKKIIMFENIIGNQVIKDTLEKSINTNQITHSYLFVGISGIGKKLIAIDFAKKILGKDTTNNPDFLLVEPDGNNIKIEQIRNLQKEIQEKPIISDKKVYIIDNADLMTKELLNKIPTKFYEMIKEERDTSYSPNIQEPLEKQKLKNETIIILGLIYRDFLCSPDEKKRLQEKDAKELQEVEKELEQQIREKYNPDDIFKNRNTIVPQEEQLSEETRMTIVQEEKWYHKIFNLINGLFHRN